MKVGRLSDYEIVDLAFAEFYKLNRHLPREGKTVFVEIVESPKDEEPVTHKVEFTVDSSKLIDGKIVSKNKKAGSNPGE